jgi:lysyl endopeptidase
MFKKIHLVFIALCILSIGNAQVKTNYNNTDRVTARGRFLKEYVPKALELAAPDVSQALRRDQEEASLGSKLFYIAEPMRVNINVVRAASWNVDGKFEYGKFTLRSKGARTLSINFSNWTLPTGTEMYIYNKDAEMITGVITEAENNANRIWGSSIYKGDEITIEIKIPAGERKNLNLQITNVAYGYKDIFVSKLIGFGSSGACNINVLCPEGAAWSEERNSVVFIARSNGSVLCSGSMLMNTCGSNIPYVLTADHCFQGDGNVAGWRVHFQAWSAACTPTTNSDGILFNGSTLRANWAPSDFCLVQLNQTPALNSGIRYAGWSRSTVPATSGVGIHHPAGDVMKISNYTNTLVREDDPTRCTINAVGQLHWVVLWNQGVTEGGSSGSPLFDQNHRVVGQLSGGPSHCGQPANCRMDMYGRFDDSWTGGGTNATRLSNWLDPSNTGVMTTNTTNINALVENLSISGPSSFCTSTSYSIPNLPPAATVTWTASPAGVVSLSSSGSTVIVNRIYNGTINLSASVVSCGVTYPVSKNGITVGTFIEGSYSTSYDGGGPLVKYPQEGYNNIQPYSWVWANVSFNPTWTKIDGTISSWNYNGYNLEFYLAPNDWVTFRATVTYNGCTSYQDYTFIAQSFFLYTVAPNPVGSELNIFIDDGKLRSQNIRKSADQNIRQVMIMDRFGNVLRQQKYTGNTRKATLNVSGLATDMYVVRIFDGKKWSSSKFLKK